MINLTEGGQFDEVDLVTHIQDSGLTYVIQGQQSVTHENHTKPNSLDCWLRQFAVNPDTKQADNIVMDALVDTGYFEIILQLQCPDSGKSCKGLRLINI